MNIPIFEKPSSIILFLGLATFIYIVSFQIDSGKNLEKKKYDGQLKIIELNYNRVMDSAECAFYTKKLENIRNNLNTTTVCESNDIELIIIKKNIINRKINAEIELIRNDIDKTSIQDKYDSSGRPQIFALTISALVLAFGVTLLFKEYEDSKRNKTSNTIMKIEKSNLSKQRLKKYFRK